MSIYPNKQAGFFQAIIFIIIGFFVLFVLFSLLSRYQGSSLPRINMFESNYTSGPVTTGTNPLLNFGDTTYDGASYGGTGGGSSSQSPSSRNVSVLYGNASYSIQPHEEYIMIRNDGSPVNITGWTLTNGKGTRPIQTIQNSYVYPAADSATIGTGTEFLDPSGVFQTGPIILASGDTAIITTGGPFSQFPFSISTSFRENICVGYLENYPFEPRLNQSCPLISNDPQIRTVTEECYDYMRFVGQCKNPEKTDKKRFDEQTTQCKSFIRARLNYPSCVANNRYAPNFSTRQWRVFLGKKSELWASQRETITLYDASGLIVDQISY